MHKKSLFIGLIATWLLFSAIVQAQGGVIGYGTTLSDKLDANVPQALYSFNGNADEVITAYILGWSPDFQPSLTLLGPTGQLAFNSADALTPISNDARITVRLPQTGAYSLLVGSANAVYETYTLTLQLNPPVISTVLGETPVELVIQPSAPAQSYSLPLAPDSPSAVSVENPQGIVVSVTLSDGAGNIVASFAGSLPSFNITLPAGSDIYQLTLTGIEGSGSGIIRIGRPGGAVNTGTPPTGNGSVGAPPPADICAVFATGNGVNLRNGPDTAYGAVGSLVGDEYVTATGQYNGWYYGTYRGQNVWLAASVTRSEGASCASLPPVQPPPPPVQPVDPVSTEEATTDNTGNTGSPTATTDSNNQTQPTAAATAPPTATTATGAPLDSDQLNWELARDSGGQYNNSVSFPTGDTTDRIRVTVADLFNQPPNNTRSFTLTMVCSGTGTENLRWGSGGPSSPSNLQCGGSINIFHTNDSNQTFLNVLMQGDGNVNYTIVATQS